MVMTLAKTSHVRRTGASRWIHVVPYASAAHALYATPEPHVSCDRATEVCYLAYQLQARRFSSCIQTFAIVMLSKARTDLDNIPHAAAKANTTSDAFPNNRPSITIMVETYGAFCCRDHPVCLRHVDFTSRVRALSPVQAMYAAGGSVVENILIVDVLHTLFIFEGCVSAILRWTRLVVFLRRCHVQSHPERASSFAQL